ncbi:PSD1 and planctomycete cytochrome C domain-containing protein [Neorhodopirellula pilleata]|nr:PSD1 and planctomycete cytochrome C domain-containing protein [Neorhodopirellula pilleata]
MNDHPLTRLDELMQARLSDALTEAEFSELRAILRSDPDAMDRYLDFCEIDIALATPLPTFLAPEMSRMVPSHDLSIAGTVSGGDFQSPNPETSTESRRHVRNPSLIVHAMLSGGPRQRSRVFGSFKHAADFWIAAASILLIVGGLGLSSWIAKSQSNRIAWHRSIAINEALSDVAFEQDSDTHPEAEIDANSRTVIPRRNEWKTIQSTGSVKHPPLIDTAVPVTAKTAVRPIRFNRDIRPILSETCFHCHGPDEHGRRADLRLDTPEGAAEDLGGYQPIVAGDLEKSEAWQRIISDDPDTLMPPPESHLVLIDDQKHLIRRWIEEGALYEGHWAFAPPARPLVPEVTIQDTAGEPWGQTPIDAFVAARMAEAGLTPSPEANPRTLIRRLTFDLTGLPPTIEQVRRFVADYQARGEEAWQDAIGRLLESPHFGERMAVPWLDQARYADTNGYSIDGGRDMWLWRDWVIHAYNENLPFDQFLVQQIAGDLLPDATEAERIATGFNRNHMVTHEGGTIPEENLTNYAADRVKTTGEVFLGLTMGCAQCHDHKYDPISQKEYYQFFAFFNELSDRGLDGNAGNNPAPKIMAKTVLPKEELPELRAELTTLQNTLQKTRDGFDAWLADAQAHEASRGNRFQTHRLKSLDVSSPNRPGDYVVRDDGSVFFENPSGGLNAMSHVLELPGNLATGQTIDGIRIRFFPHGEGDAKRLTPHAAKVPQVTTVLVSAGELPAKQVDIYRQKSFAQATASSAAENRAAYHVLDERNDDWWMPVQPDQEQHLTLTFDEPVRVDQTPYLSVMVFFGVNQSLPHHWRIDAFSGIDTDSRFAPSVAEAIATPQESWTDEQRDLVLQTYRQDAPALERLQVRIANVQERIDVLTKPYQTMVMDTAAKPRETFVLARGQYDAPGEKVTPSTLEVLPDLLSPESDGAESPARATRLDLARWMIDPKHPLTSRVAVNRIWSLFFGTGIVATSADFGSQGEWPSHPELLDYLATEFVAGGWDQKELIRRIVSSSTYRQDSFASAENRRIDPKNRLLARGPSFRLSAEFIRDQALAVSGLLVPRIGGPSVHPYQPAGLWKEVSHFGSTPATKQVFVQDHGEKLYRRSLYTITKRTSPHPSMSAFDAPNREMCTVQRGITNTPLQALVTLNDTQFAEAARVLAGDLLKYSSPADENERLKTAFERVTSRLPNEDELTILKQLLADERKRYESSPEQAVATISVGEWPVERDLDPVEHAAWTQVAALLLNLSETVTHL